MMRKIYTRKTLILASGSETRKAMLDRIDLDFKVVVPNIDEDALKKAFQGLNYSELGMKLAEHKGLDVSARYPDAYVIAGDQLCIFENKMFDKPGSLENCFTHLKALSGKTHTQNSFAVICHDSKVIWQRQFQACLTMRSLSDAEISSYIKLEKPLNACGSYMLEKHGKYLFSDIQGDHDVILGLPLVPILNKLFELDLILF